MHRGLIFPGGGMTLEEMLTVAREAEAASFDSLYCVEAWRSAFVPLAALACETQRVRLGSYVINAYGRSPFITGMSAVDLDELSGGRLLLAVGSGNRHINEDYQGIPHERPLRKMREYVELLRMISRTPAGGEVAYDGEVHRMHWHPAVQPVRPSIPVYVAGIYPKMVKVAASVGDGLALGALLSADYIREVLRPLARDAAEAAGRDPNELGYLMSGFVAADEDRERARNAVRLAICSLFHPLPHPYYEFLLREQGFSEAADAALRHVPEGRTEAAMEAMDDKLVDALAMTGSPKDCAEGAAAYDGLVDEVIFTNVGAVTSTLSGDGASVVDSYRAVLRIPATP